MAALWLWGKGVGEAIWGDSGRYRIAKIYPGLRAVHAFAPGSSLLSVAEEKDGLACMVCNDENRDHQERQGQQYTEQFEFLGALFTSSLQNSYYPRHDRTFDDTMSRFGGALLSDAVGDLLREFTPDIKRFFRKHAPKKLLHLEQKLPIPADDKV